MLQRRGHVHRAGGLADAALLVRDDHRAALPAAGAARASRPDRMAAAVRAAEAIGGSSRLSRSRDPHSAELPSPAEARTPAGENGISKQQPRSASPSVFHVKQPRTAFGTSRRQSPGARGREHRSTARPPQLKPAFLRTARAASISSAADSPFIASSRPPGRSSGAVAGHESGQRRHGAGQDDVEGAAQIAAVLGPVAPDHDVREPQALDHLAEELGPTQQGLDEGDPDVGSNERDDQARAGPAPDPTSATVAPSGIPSASDRAVEDVPVPQSRRPRADRSVRGPLRRRQAPRRRSGARRSAGRSGRPPSPGERGRQRSSRPQRPSRLPSSTDLFRCFT